MQDYRKERVMERVIKYWLILLVVEESNPTWDVLRYQVEG
jgi:hypothetical protein